MQKKSLHDNLRRYLRLAQDLAFPRRCPYCNAVIGFEQNCESCQEKIKGDLHAPFRLSATEHELRFIEEAASLFLYRNLPQKAIRMMKYESRPWYGRELAYEMAAGIYGCSFAANHGIIQMKSSGEYRLQYDLVVPIPSSHKNRGYDSTETIALYLAEALQVPLEAGNLYKAVATRPQAGLSAEERRTNVVGSMKIKNPDRIDGKRVLLVDDVITTGATISEAARVLTKAGAESVYAVSAAAAEL